MFSLIKGFTQGYYSGDPLKLLEDIQLLKPTIFCSVPRILNRVYGRIMDTMQQKSGFVQWLFNRAIETKKANYEKDGTL